MSRKKKGGNTSPKSKVAGKEASDRGQSERQKEKNVKGGLPQNRGNSLNLIVAGLAIAGMILTVYLSITGWLNQAPVLCTEGSSCDIVQQSRWGTFLGMPTAFWGFLTYTSLLIICIKIRNPVKHWQFAWPVAMIGLLYSAYLISISIFFIQAACFYCLISFSIMTVIFALLTLKRPKKSTKLDISTYAKQTVFIAVIFVGIMHLYYSGFIDPKMGPEDPYLKGLAVHLRQNQAIVYGAYW